MTKYKKHLADVVAYKPGKPIEEITREYGLTDVVKLASNENACGPSPKALEAIRKELDNCNYYPESSVYFLKKALAKRLDLPETQLLFDHGGDAILRLLGLMYMDSQSEVVTFYPSFAIYDVVCQCMNCKLIKAPMRDFVPHLPDLLPLINEKTKIIFLANPNNPTGTTFGAEEFNEFVEKVPEDILIVHDEAYERFVERSDFPDAMGMVREKRPNIAVLRSFSKTHGLAGLRIAYIAAHPEVIQIMWKVRPVFTPNRLAQVATLAAIEDQEHMERSKQVVIQGKRYLEKEFKRLNIWFLPTEANFYFVDFKRDVNEVYLELLKEGVIIRPLAQGFARISIGLPDGNKKLIEAMEKVL